MIIPFEVSTVSGDRQYPIMLVAAKRSLEQKKRHLGRHLLILRLTGVGSADFNWRIR